MTDFEKRFSDYILLFNSYAESEMARFASLSPVSPGSEFMIEAMSYSLVNTGKRIRPVLCLEFCRACGGDYKKALPFALGAEMIHTYSLIHDDLPCMDDDDYRRGRESSHKKFGYANALLAGDSLLTLAFEELANADVDAAITVEAVKMLSGAAGFRGMVAGQVMDLENENKAADIDTVRFTDELKTGEMIRVSALLGCAAAGEKGEKREACVEYCKNIGLAFQIVDDILDVTGDFESTGKAAGSDEKSNKSTYVSLLGVDGAKKYARELTSRALEALDIFGQEGEFLKELAVNLSDRTK